MKSLNKLLLSEMRVLEANGPLDVKDLDLSSVNELGKALLDNENLKALGYQLKVEAIVRLAAGYKSNPSMKPLFKRVMELEPRITVSPMYPNFPTQVLEMSDLEYKVNQVLHYISTYGVEKIFGVEVQEGWLPETTEIDERQEDILVVGLKTLDYLSKEEVDDVVIKNLIGRKERLLPKEIQLAQQIALRTDLKIEEVPFKENIGVIFGDILLNGETSERQQTFNKLADIVKHPGDVLDLVEYVVVTNKYKHLKTSVKRGFVYLIEAFPADKIEENFASNRWSRNFLGKGAKSRRINRNIALIDYLSYTRFSKNEVAKKLVGDMKNGILKSWNQNLEAAYKAEDFAEVLNLLSQRPGMMFRQINRLVTLGVSAEDISSVLKPASGELKTQSIVSALNNFNGSETVVKVFMDTLVNNLAQKDLGDIFADKKVYIDEGEVDFSKSRLEITDKFEEGGYITNGLAIKLPEDADLLRFFTYWNDERRIDIDLHVNAIDKNGETSHVGWNGSRKNDYLVHSGDITHSNAAEYTDLRLSGLKEKGIERVQFNINSYTSVPFDKIDTIFTGLMAISEMGAKADLFDPKNVIFRHDLQSASTSIEYAVVDVQAGVLYIIGKTSSDRNDTKMSESLLPALSIKTYLGILAMTHGATIVADKETADLVVGFAKADQDNYISLADENFFMDK